MFFSVKNLCEHPTIHRWHFSRSSEGFANRMNTFFPDSSSFFERIPPSFRVSRVCRTFSPRTMLGAYHFLSFFYEKSVNTHTKPSNQMQCLSESCGGSNLFLESVRVTICVVMLLFTEFFTTFKSPLLLPVISYYFC